MSGDILLLAATEAECRPVLTRMTRVLSEGNGRSGEIAGRRCRLLTTGVGPVNTAHLLTREAEREMPRIVAQFGIGGAYVPSGLAVGDAAVASEEIYGDLGAESPDGWLSMEQIGFPTVSGAAPLYNRFPLDLKRAERVASACGGSVGAFLTVSTCTGTAARAAELYERFGAVCENMEGAAAAHVCAAYGLPFVELRGISNLIENRDRSRWRIKEAVAAAGRAVVDAVSKGALDG